jgi:hypothetical protein
MRTLSLPDVYTIRQERRIKMYENLDENKCMCECIRPCEDSIEL